MSWRKKFYWNPEKEVLVCGKCNCEVKKEGDIYICPQCGQKGVC